MTQGAHTLFLLRNQKRNQRLNLCQYPISILYYYYIRYYILFILNILSGNHRSGGLPGRTIHAASQGKGSQKKM